MWHPEEEKSGIQQHVYPSQRASTDHNKKLVLSHDPGWKAEIPSHGATYFLCWSAVHFACCCCFDKSPVRVTAGFWCLLVLAAFPVVRPFLQMCRMLDDVRTKLLAVFLSVGEAQESKKKGRFSVASCQDELVLLACGKVSLLFDESSFFPETALKFYLV